MTFRPLTDGYAVAPQITPEDLAALRAAGFTTIIDNRPDSEIPADLHAAEMRRAAEAEGFTFVENPVIGGAITLENVHRQREAIDAATGPVLAYCASGNRSSVVWALANAGRMPTDDLIALPARHGYQLEGFRREIDRLAQQGT
ncbi:TIGR01244 family sulfur transferase [Cereibacter sediminicola]|uniref:TIGR01244 family sulfur transferase n=1 Tax=Cereibacter sediminicola TaxID=2584941 RepID=UPI00119F9FC1|nr:protein tyrosine phosphatase family protein [Cereibacter sediminicola]